MRRRRLHSRFCDRTDVTPEEIAEVLFQFDEDQVRRVKDREDAMRIIRAKKRDLHNQQILGY